MTISFPPDEPFTKRLSDLILMDGLSHSELCSEIHVQRKSLYCWLNGTYYPQYDALIRLSDYFKVSINYLLGISYDAYTAEHCPIEEVPEQFITKLKNYINDNRLSRYALSKKVGVGQCTLNRWFECNSMPETAVIIRIAKVVGQSVDYLLGYE